MRLTAGKAFAFRERTPRASLLTLQCPHEAIVISFPFVSASRVYPSQDSETHRAEFGESSLPLVQRLRRRPRNAPGSPSRHTLGNRHTCTPHRISAMPASCRRQLQRMYHARALEGSHRWRLRSRRHISQERRWLADSSSQRQCRSVHRCTHPSPRYTNMFRGHDNGSHQQRFHRRHRHATIVGARGGCLGELSPGYPSAPSSVSRRPARSR
ncbi:hypothetical protein PHYPSEUDO_007639 [Phytophthora pseudosyringae]|uniref:Uncharacterized protein n=1 Tax=Phytophthora pseudosyringae TaxID=221518 RepID=A0A8T1VFY9_9STRA|nr:hypothetical protein PHYPSEUDO_007639 [Phytophthora pseudosyringae]